MVQAKSRIGLLTDGDSWFVFIADISASSPAEDTIRVARFSEVHGNRLFSGNPYAILLACLHMVDELGLPLVPDHSELNASPVSAVDAMFEDADGAPALGTTTAAAPVHRFPRAVHDRHGGYIDESAAGPSNYTLRDMPSLSSMTDTSSITGEVSIDVGGEVMAELIDLTGTGHTAT